MRFDAQIAADIGNRGFVLFVEGASLFGATSHVREPRARRNLKILRCLARRMSNAHISRSLMRSGSFIGFHQELLELLFVSPASGRRSKVLALFDAQHLHDLGNLILAFTVFGLICRFEQALTCVI